MITEGWKKLYDAQGNWIGMHQTAIFTREEWEHYNQKYYGGNRPAPEEVWNTRPDGT